MVLEVINSLAKEEWLSIPVSSETDALTLLSGPKEASIMTRIPACCEHTVCAAVNLFHLLGFLLEIDVGSLDDAN